MNSDARSLLVDMHCHVDLFPNPEAIVRAIDANKVHTIAVTNAPSVFGYTERLAKRCSYLHAAVGLHPELVPTHKHELESMWPMLERTQFVGEIGLDYGTNDKALRAQQRKIFVEILERCASARDKIITVHSRRAAGDVIAAIGNNFPGRVVMHWFSGSLRELDGAIQNGLYFSLNPAMFESQKGRQLVAAIPRERVLTESDGPFVQIAGSTISPESASATLQRLSQLWAVPPEETARIVTDNCCNILGIDKN
jgi:TatD DNase family protein